MKTKLFLFLFLSLCSASQLRSQLTGGNGNGQSPTSEVEASEITAGSISGEVNLFSGTYNSSYGLGSVATPSGLQFNLQLSYNSNFASGENLPHSSGMPYGEGWSLDLPTISVSTEDYHKYTLSEVFQINENHDLADYTQFYNDDNNCGPANTEGRLYWFSPMLNIPGQASGRLVFKKKQGNSYLFVLHAFERHVEAWFDGNQTWEIIMDDGTRYVLGAKMIAHRNASNQRVEDPCNDDDATKANLFLPKSEILSWYCDRIYHTNLPGNIHLEYDTYGCFDFFGQYTENINRQALINHNLLGLAGNAKPALGSVNEACKEIILKKVYSETEELNLDYENILTTYINPADGENLLVPGVDGAEFYDEMYTRQEVADWTYGEELSDWKRYLHVKSPELNLLCVDDYSINPTNPYKGHKTTDLIDEPSYVRQSAGIGKTFFGIPFRHGFLQSPRISASTQNDNMPAGDIYQVQSLITNTGNTALEQALFDINLSTGDNIYGLQTLSLNENNEMVPEHCYDKRYGNRAFTTYNQAIKWLVSDDELATSNFFTMPNLPNQYQGFNIQIGLANSDTDNGYDFICPLSGVNSPDVCATYFNNNGIPPSHLAGNIMESGAAIPYNFGVGLPWFSLREDYNAALSHCENTAAIPFWWNDRNNNPNESGEECDLLPGCNWPSIPTKAPIDIDGDGLYLKRASIFRYAKNPYMLSKVVKKVHNAKGGLLTVSQVALRYDLQKVRRFVTAKDGMDNSAIERSYSKDQRNIFRLKKIRQLPIGAADFADAPNAPTTHLEYAEEGPWGPNPACDFYVGCDLEVYNSNFSLLHKITDPLGKETSLEYYPLGPVTEGPNPAQGSYSIYNYYYNLRPQDMRSIPVVGGYCRSTVNSNGYQMKSQSNPYAFQTYMVVKSKTVKDKDFNKVWNYNFSNPVQSTNRAPMNDQFNWDGQFNIRGGFAQATVVGPTDGNTLQGPSRNIQHHGEPLLFGKIKRVEERDYNGMLVSDTDMQYETLKAFEAPWTTATTIDHPDMIPLVDQYETPYFYETRFAQYITDNYPEYLHSFFVKATRQVNTIYDTGGSMKTTTEFDYFDADANLITNSPGYAAMGISGPLTQEPSWKLYRTRTDYPHANAYTIKENFYLYDLANDPRYQIDPNPPNPYDYDPHLHTGLTMLWQVHSLNKVRNLPYETRVTTKAPGQAPVTKSTYYEYRNDWDADDPNFTITRIPNPAGPGDEWPCGGDVISSDNGPVGGTGYDPGVIYTPDNLPCIYYHSDSPPPIGDYNCPLEGFNYWYCQCDLNANGNLTRNSGQGNLTNPNTLPSPYYGGNAAPFQIQDDHDDPNDAFINNTLVGKIMLEKVQQQVVSGPTQVSTFSSPTFQMQHPHTVRLLTKVNSRNRYGQVVEEEDLAGLKTRYVFSEANAVEYEDCYQDSIHSMVLLYLNENPGLPTEVIMGYGRSDALKTKYEYDLRKRVIKVIDPNGTELSYDYDAQGRLHHSYRNGTLFQKNEYHQWQNNTALSFTNRAYQNYVETTTYIDDTQSTFDRSYLDPLGRERGVVKDGAFVLSNPIYNNVGQNILQLKPSLGALPIINFTGNPTEHTETEYERNFRSRPLKSAKNGLSITGSHILSNSYCSSSDVELASDLQAAGLTVSTPPGNLFYKTTTTDEDGKTVTEYSNVSGQKVATFTLNSTAATVFYYNSQGQVSQVINPAGQSSTYDYNYLGQLYRKTTVDDGTTYYAYDERDQLIAELDAAGETRLFLNDLYGRMRQQSRATTISAQSSIFADEGRPWIGPSGMSDWLYAVTNSSTPEKRWHYDDFFAADYQMTTTETRNYLNNSLSNTTGKLVQTTSYNLAGNPIQFKFLSYNDDGFLKWEIEQFNYNGISANYPGLTTRMDYPRYNRQGSVITQNIDLDCDQTLDLQYYYTYDSWNRIKEVYAQFDNSKNLGHKVASYEYDDVKGVVTHRKHYVSDGACTNVEVDAVQYSYDANRFRLTNINSALFEWRLYYDGSVGMGSPNYSKNYNGNINVSEANYKLGIASNTPGNFLTPTVYNYEYDALNRLTGANATIEETRQGVLDPLNSGDATYTYDKVGNFDVLKRYSFSSSGNSEYRRYEYRYGTGNNRLDVLRLGVNGASPSNYRSFQYDARGNLSFDSQKNITDVDYGWANLPWEITRNNGGAYSYINYRYDINDARIYKETRATPAGVATSSEYYLRSASGQELGIYDFNQDELQWYVYGSDRIAKFEHLPTSNWSGVNTELGLRSRTPDQQTPTLSLAEEKRTVLADTRFGDQGQIDCNNDKNLEKLTLARRLRQSDGSYAFPNNLYYIKDRSNESEAIWLQEEWVYFDSTRYELLQQIPLESEQQRLVFEDVWGQPLTLSFGELGLDGLGPQPDPTPSPQDPFTEDLPDLSNPPTPAWEFYLYDHLGNTRVVYSVDLNTACSPTFHLKHVQDYFPYGQSLRKFTTGGDSERFLSTQHERDVETGFDYRGARFYDAEIGRFLSLDPLAATFPNISAYNYVFANPILLIDPTGRAPEETDNQEGEELSGWTETNAWLATGFNGSIDEFTDYIETIFVDEQGNTIVETQDGSDEVFVIKNSNQEKFINELKGKVEADLDRSVSDNNNLGNKYGFNLKNIYTAYGLNGFEKDVNFNMGYLCGYHRNSGACLGTYAAMGEGKGGGGPSFGNQIGITHKKKGLISLVSDNKISDAFPMYSIVIKPIFSKSDRIIGFNKNFRKN